VRASPELPRKTVVLVVNVATSPSRSGDPLIGFILEDTNLGCTNNRTAEYQFGKLAALVKNEKKLPEYVEIIAKLLRSVKPKNSSTPCLSLQSLVLSRCQKANP
jgi:hypothetical protein